MHVRAVPALLVVALTASGGSACADAGVCNAEPAEPLTVLLHDMGEQRSQRFAGTVGSVEARAGGFTRFVLVDSAGTERRVDVRGASVPLELGKAYEVRVDFVGGAPDASGIVVQDADGLLFAGASDQRIGAHVLVDGVPGFTFELRSTDCGSRVRDKCYDAVVNARLRVGRDDASADLWNGRSARLGNYLVTCLTAQQVTYNDRCADAGLVAVSWTLVRN